MDRLLAALRARIRRFAQSEDPSGVLDSAALIEADQLWKAAQPADGDPHSVSVDVLTVLAGLHYARYQALPGGEGQNDLRTALGLFGMLADRAPDQVPDQIRDLLAAASPESPSGAEHLTAKGAGAFSEYERTRRPEALDAALTAFRDAVAAIPPGHPYLPAMLSNLEIALRTRFNRAGEAADLDAAIGAGQRAVDLAPPDYPDLARYLSNLGIALCARFEWAGDGADLDAAIGAGQRAVDLAPPGHPDLTVMLSNLGLALRTRFEWAGDGADLDAAIDAGQRAVDLAPLAHPGLAAMLSNLGSSLCARFEWAGDGADLDAAIDAGQRAVDLAPPGDSGLAKYLSNLGTALLRRFERTGDGADLDAAIDAIRQAVDLSPPDHPDLVPMQSNLGAALLRRFERTGDGADLDAAIGAGRRAVDLAPPDRPGLSMYLSNLGMSLRAQFERAGDGADLDAAIDAGRRAVALTPPGNPGLTGWLSNLGSSLCARFERAGDGADLDAAIDAIQQAVDLAPPSHPDLTKWLSNLGGVLFMRFERTGDDADLDAAIGAGRRAVDVTPPGHPDLAPMLSTLGGAVFKRFERAGDGKDLDAAISSWQRASQVPAGTPRVRLATARAWGAAAADAGRMNEAAAGYAAAVGLLPVVAFHGLDRATREEQLAQWAGVAADAAACAILDGRPETAVELLEQGRSVLWTQALNLRSDLTRLASQAPGLAERLTSIRQILDAPMPEAAALVSATAGGAVPVADGARRQQEAADLRRRKAREWDDTVAQVRALDGFEHFLAAVPYTDLAAAAADGPVVIVNASRHGCHALITEAGSAHARVVSLPGLSLDAAADQASTMLRALAGAAGPRRAFPDRERDRHAILDVLDWLWDAIAQPVLAALGHTTTPDIGSPWPRVWWCPTGPLTVLPVHAAGHHPRLRTAAARSNRSVPDRVISSCTPTLAALARTRQPAADTPVRQLTIGMPAAPGQPPLPAVRDELTILARHFPPGNGNHQLAQSQATRAAVLAAVADHSWVHLACHAGQQDADPARSGFALWDGTLTITDLAAQPTRGRDLAFLSACQTAAGSVRHLDEAIHLAAAMQFLGYRHVIATLWTIADRPAPDIADIVYTTLTRDGKPDPGRAAEALHHAIQDLRQRDPTNPLLWAPYIHLGT